MSFNIRIPNITASTPTEQIRQVHSYLYQVVEQLNWALNTIESTSENVNTSTDTRANADTQTAQEDNSLNTFNSIKGLIIKSADIVNAYYEEIDNLLKLSGEYVAEASFPEGSAKFIEKTTSSLDATSTYISQNYTNMQEISSNLESINDHLSIDDRTVIVNGRIKSGLLFYEGETPVYGVEVGQETKNSKGETVFNQYARFTANRLSFFDSNGYEAAYISDKKLYIDNVEINISFKMGGFVDTVRLPDKSVVTKWVGGN